MREIIYTFTQTHQVMQAEEYLLHQNIPVRIMALPGQIGQGCGMCLRVDIPNQEAATNTLLQYKVPILGIYLKERKQGQTCYYPL